VRHDGIDDRVFGRRLVQSMTKSTFSDRIIDAIA